MINVLYKELETSDLSEPNVSNAVVRMTLFMHTNTNSALHSYCVDLNDFDPDNWVEFDDITDDNLIDWYCARKGITKAQLETKLNTEPSGD